MFVAGRYLKAKKSQRFINFTTLLSILGITIGVMTLIVVIAVMTGFEEDIKTKILGTQSHIVISGYSGGLENPDKAISIIKKDPGVLGASPFILTQGLITASSGSRGIVIRGIDTMMAPSVIRIKGIMKRGSFSDLDDSSVLVGTELARSIGVDVGDSVSIVSPGGVITPLGIIPTSSTFRVAGLFSTGMYEFDSNMVYITIGAAKRLTGQKGVSGIEIKVKDIYSASVIARRLLCMLGPDYWAKTWKDMNRSLFSALRMEKTVMVIILLFIILVAVFSMVSTLIMLVMEKRRDIAILKAMGAKSIQVMKIFLIHGLAIGITGTCLGLVLGLMVSYNLTPVVSFIETVFHVNIMPKDVYYITGLPTKVEFWDVFFITSISMLLSLVATLYPARQASNQDPVEVLRYE
ncbi:MAG: lipoprotein-releasing ABC transporter permease subunit [Deltaproteobacteria bacterium]|nr:lipoprotein-releasing ABC transporter permease subunit [Deltaproteobacteria bacterium]